MEILKAPPIAYLLALVHCFGLIAGAHADAEGIPAEPRCLKRVGDQTSREALSAAGIGEDELLARLVFAEGVSTGVDRLADCRSNAEAIFESVAWGVMSRVRMGEASPAIAKRYGKGISGVVFQPSQFNPAVSKRSRFSRFFLCPKLHSDWQVFWNHAKIGSRRALESPARNPFLQSPWEKKNGISLVSHFYYPRSEQATPVPPSWANASPSSATLAKNLVVAGRSLGSRCIWFFRLEKPFSR